MLYSYDIGCVAVLAFNLNTSIFTLLSFFGYYLVKKEMPTMITPYFNFLAHLLSAVPCIARIAYCDMIAALFLFPSSPFYRFSLFRFSGSAPLPSLPLSINLSSL